MASHAASKVRIPLPPSAAHERELWGFDWVEPPAISHRGAQTLACVRGIRFAILGEIVAGLCAYGVWRFFWG